MCPAAPLVPFLKDEMVSRLKEIIHARTGLKFSEHQHLNTTKVLIKEIKHAGADTPEQYFSLLSSHPINTPIWDDLIKALTICETYFFRDADQMQLLRKHIIPDLVARHWNDHTLRLWSAGCATGEEAYTLAMLLRQGIPDIERWRISILATDINKYALEKAQRGIYGEWSFRQQTVDDPQVHPYFSKDSAGYQIHSSVKEMVRFAYLNLADESFPSSANQTDLLDLILCRNVTMYLSETVIQQLSRRFYASLQPGGWLMVGASENKDAFYSQFKTLMYEKALVYQKVTNYPAPSTAPESMQARQGTDPLRRALPQVKIEFNPAQAVQPTEPALPPARPAARPTPPPKPGNDSSGNLLQAATALINEHKFDSLPQ